LGYPDTDVAHDGIEAVEMSLEKEYDIILMDVNMPRQDGLQSTNQYISPEFRLNSRIREREHELGSPRTFICG